MKLSKQEIQFADNFLIKRNIKYLDIRVELLDHLATGFEESSNYGLIEDYLLKKEGFIRDFAKKQQKTIHWSYQKQLWTQFAKFFYKPKFMIQLILLVILSYTLFHLFTLKIFAGVCFFVLLILIIYPLYYQIKYSKALKKVQSLQSLFTVTALPSLFLYTYNVVVDQLLNNPLLLIIYYSFAILLGISAAMIIENDRKKLLKKYKQLIN